MSDEQLYDIIRELRLELETINRAIFLLEQVAGLRRGRRKHRKASK